MFDIGVAKNPLRDLIEKEMVQFVGVEPQPHGAWNSFRFERTARIISIDFGRLEGTLKSQFLTTFSTKKKT